MSPASGYAGSVVLGECQVQVCRVTSDLLFCAQCRPIRRYAHGVLQALRVWDGPRYWELGRRREGDRAVAEGEGLGVRH